MAGENEALLPRRDQPTTSSGSSRASSSSSPLPLTLDLDDAIDAIGYGRYQVQVLFVCGATQLADAAELLLISFLADEVRCQWSLGPFCVALLSTVVFLGMLAGACSLGVLSDMYGRRVGYLVSVGFTAAFGIVSVFSPAFWFLALCRFFVGVGVGSAPAALSLYTEFLPRSRRGQQLIYCFTFFSVGSLMEALIAAWTRNTVYGWRALLLASAIPSVLLLFLFPWVPESPRFLLVKGKQAEAKKALEKVAAVNRATLPAGWADVVLVAREDLGKGGDDGHDDNEESASQPQPRPRDQDILTSSSSSAQHKEGGAGGGDRGVGGGSCCYPSSDGSSCFGAGALLAPQLRRTTVILCALYTLMALLYYALVLVNTELVRDRSAADPGTQAGAGCGDSGGSSACIPAPPAGSGGGGGAAPHAPKHTTDEFVRIVITNSAELPGLLVAALLLDRLGRRRTIAVLFVACGLLCGLIAIPPVFHSQAASLVLVFCARASALGFNQSLWIFTTECFPTSVRAMGLGVTTGFARIGGMLSPFLVAYLFAWSCTAGLLACVGIAAAAALIAARVAPVDTLRRPLTDLVRRHMGVIDAALRKEGAINSAVPGAAAVTD